MSTCSQRTFKWTEQQFTLKQLVAQYRHLLPFPVLVTQDCTQRKEPKISPCCGQVYWIHDVIKSKYLIVKNKQGKQFKIPENMDAMVITTKRNGTEGKPVPFRDIRSEVGFKYFRFTEPQPEVIGPAMQPVNDKVSLRDLQLFDISDEDMLVVHSIFMENLMAPCKRGSNQQPHHKVVPQCFKLMPTYLPISVSIAVSLTLAPDLIYFHTLSEIKQIVDGYEHNYRKAIGEAAEILLDETSDSVYVNIASVVSTNQESRVAQTPPEICGYPLSLAKAIDPLEKLQCVSVFYKTGDAGSFAIDVDKLENDGFLEPDNWLNTWLPRKDSTSITKQAASKRSTTWLRMRFPKHKDKQTRKPSISDSRNANPPATSQKPLEHPYSKEQHRTSVPLLPSQVRQKAAPMLPQRHSFDFRSDSGAKPKVNGSSERRISSITEVPSDISGLSIDQVMDCLKLLNMSDYVPLMQSKKVDGRLLMCMNEEDLKSVFGFNEFSATKLVQFAQCGWRPKTEVGGRKNSGSGFRFQRNITSTKKSGRHNSVY